MSYLLTNPIILITSLLLAIANKDKPFFFQPRPGKDERIFNIIKFKTMTDEKDKNNQLLPDSKRLTKVGTFVRKNYLDELPQLINVMKGDMSLIGPRPLHVHYLPQYNKKQRRRHEAMPGISGWAQVNGRNSISWDQKFKYDVWYVDNISFRLDVKIIFMTIFKFFKKNDVEIEDVVFSDNSFD
ncbi:MAG: sugar transferase [Mycoplasmataceae bacterium]|nr:sugar transferase [Mycoplasmataceae bacterium]